jgi:hypothetical protein
LEFGVEKLPGIPWEREEAVVLFQRLFSESFSFADGDFRILEYRGAGRGVNGGSLLNKFDGLFSRLPGFDHGVRLGQLF